MYVKRRYPVLMAVWWSKSSIFFAVPYALAITAAFELGGQKWLSIPWQPLSLVGVLVAFGLGFKNNSAYGRTWEARMVWGAIVNASRHWAVSVQGFVSNQFRTTPLPEAELKALHQQLIYRHLAWLAALRVGLRTDRTWEHVFWPADKAMREQSPERLAGLDKLLTPFVGEEERKALLAVPNAATHLLARQGEALRQLRQDGLIDDFRHVALMETLKLFFDDQGKCERLKNFPFPRQYSTFNHLALWAFGLTLPMGLLDVMAQSHSLSIWATVPFSALVTWLFFITEMIGDYTENPFEGLWNDVPITALSRTIEIDLRSLLGETELPRAIVPVQDVLF